jgi:DegV family protein with EDD domain
MPKMPSDPTRRRGRTAIRHSKFPGVLVSVITDSAASLPPSLAAEYGVVAVPMQLKIGGQSIDERTISMSEVVAHLEEGVLTSGPSPGVFVEALEGISDAGAVILTVGAHLSSTYQAASTAARLANSERVRVVDTGTAAGAEGLVVLAAAETARAGGSLDAVEVRARDVAGKVHLVAAVGTLAHLARGGRVPAVAGWAGSQLGIRVLFEFRDRHIRLLRPSLSFDKATDLIFEHWQRSKVEGAPLHVAALHGVQEDTALGLLDRVRAHVQPAISFVGTFGPVMVAHTGPDVIGLAWWWGT